MALTNKYRASFLDGLQDLDVLDGGGFNLERVFVEDHQVGEFPGFESSFCIFFLQLIGCCGSDSAKRIIGRDSLIGSDHLASSREAIHAGIDKRQDRRSGGGPRSVFPSSFRENWPPVGLGVSAVIPAALKAAAFAAPRCPEESTTSTGRWDEIWSSSSLVGGRPSFIARASTKVEGGSSTWGRCRRLLSSKGCGRQDQKEQDAENTSKTDHGPILQMHATTRVRDQKLEKRDECTQRWASLTTSSHFRGPPPSELLAGGSRPLRRESEVY